jgi:hypothetical protein
MRQAKSVVTLASHPGNQGRKRHSSIRISLFSVYKEKCFGEEGIIFYELSDKKAPNENIRNFCKPNLKVLEINQKKFTPFGPGLGLPL